MGSSYRDLLAWQKGMELVTAVYHATRGFPVEERYGLTGQLRRAAVSVPSNIAEGQSRVTEGEFQQGLSHARGSLAELETQVIIARNLSLLKQDSAAGLLEKAAEVGRLLNGLMRSLNRAR